VTNEDIDHWVSSNENMGVLFPFKKLWLIPIFMLMGVAVMVADKQFCPKICVCDIYEEMRRADCRFVTESMGIIGQTRILFKFPTYFCLLFRITTADKITKIPDSLHLYE
jgi:hypothetical protein